MGTPNNNNHNKNNQYLMGYGRKAYRKSIQHHLIPALRAFNPDLILMSTGFDGAHNDIGNTKLSNNKKQYLHGMDLIPEDYAWTTSKIMEVADICCQGRVVSVLEGGYGYYNNDHVLNNLLLLNVLHNIYGLLLIHIML